MTASRKLVISMNSWQESLWHRCTAHLWLDLCSQLTYHQNCFIRIVLSDLNPHHQYSSVILLLLSTKGRVLPTAPWCIHQSSRCIIIIIIEERWKPETTCGRDSDGYLERGIFRRSQVLLLFQEELVLCRHPGQDSLCWHYWWWQVVSCHIYLRTWSRSIISSSAMFHPYQGAIVVGLTIL